MGKRTATEANMDSDDHGFWLETPTFYLPQRLTTQSPPFPQWNFGGRSNHPCVEPAAAHARVRPLPKLFTAIEQPTKTFVTSVPNSQDERATQFTQSTAPTPIFAPTPRRGVSPDLIFQSAKESLIRNQRVETQDENDRMRTNLAELSRRQSFRPIAAGRSDIEVTSPPARATNPVIMDTRFQSMQRLDLKLDARNAPFQPFCPRARRHAPIMGPA
ncbi:hypothetical protein Poli38472_003117 [Pythium oligandrum]|uniref:Uncharacterized protein n=1 Tax=Pythium oligandrum TaxID=41045 RepID=A0A8K1C703_PYTOL|nr:hypothetical protein Poli38472_003117 [Pythium oligandrum]|eukprot:TMW57192.1 hypothetical protein Poli38472_003117 [Pythium oligandrum]